MHIPPPLHLFRFTFSVATDAGGSRAEPAVLAGGARVNLVAVDTPGGTRDACVYIAQALKDMPIGLRGFLQCRGGGVDLEIGEEVAPGDEIVREGKPAPA